ncbi:MAG: hypothetical protein AAF304_04310 [Pseudomonadota bacterium]
MTLTTALRATAVILILTCVYQFFFFNQLPVKTIVVAHILFILSFFSDQHTRRIAIICIGLSIVVPIGVWRMMNTGEVTLDFVIANLVIFIYIAYVAYQSLKNT